MGKDNSEKPAYESSSTSKSLSSIIEKAPKMKMEEEGRSLGPTSFPEKLKEDLMRLVKFLIWVIVGIIILLIGYHVIATIIERTKEMQGIEQLRSARLEEIVRILQVGVSSILVPIVTLFLGFIFGRREE